MLTSTVQCLPLVTCIQGDASLLMGLQDGRWHHVSVVGASEQWPLQVAAGGSCRLHEVTTSDRCRWHHVSAAGGIRWQQVTATCGSRWRLCVSAGMLHAMCGEAATGWTPTQELDEQCLICAPCYPCKPPARSVWPFELHTCRALWMSRALQYINCHPAVGHAGAWASAACGLSCSLRCCMTGWWARAL